MPKLYPYEDLSFDVSDDMKIELSIEFISDGNSGTTRINLPGSKELRIKDTGTISLGKGIDLREASTVCFSALSNPIPEEDEIIVHYKINGQTVVEHVNAKSETRRPYIILIIKFPGSASTPSS